MSYIVKIRRSDGSGLHSIQKIKLNKSAPFNRGTNPNDGLLRALKELIRTKGIPKLGSNDMKNVLKYRTNAQPRTLSQIQNFPSKNVITSITNIDNSKVKTCVTSTAHYLNPVATSVVPTNNIQTSFVVTSNTHNNNFNNAKVSYADAAAQPIISTIQTSNTNFTTCVKPTSTIQSSSPYQTSMTISRPNNILNNSVTNQNRSALNNSRADSIPQYTFQVKTPKNSIGSPTITSTSFTPIKTTENRLQNTNLQQRSQPIFIRKDLSHRDDYSNSTSDYKYEVKSDLDEEEFDEDFDEKDIFPSQPVRTFCVSTGSNKNGLNSAPNNGLSNNNNVNKFNRTVKVSMGDFSRGPSKINVIGRSSFVPVSII